MTRADRRPGPASARDAHSVRVLVVAGVLAVLLARGLVLVGIDGTRDLVDTRHEVTALRLDAALQTFRPADHPGLAKPMGPDDLAADHSVRTQPVRCAPLALLATGAALDARSWTGGAGAPLRPVNTLTVRYADARSARHDLLVKRAALLRCGTVRLTFPPFDQPAQEFTVTGRVSARPAGPEVLRYGLRRGERTYRFYVRRYANTLTWSYADDLSTPQVGERVVNSLVVRLQELDRQ